MNMNNTESTVLNDTLRCIAMSGHTVEQIVFIGTESGFSLTWDEFVSMTTDHNQFAELASDLVIEFSDSKTLWREADYEYGCSSWAFQRPFTRPYDTVKPSGILQDDCWCPDELQAIHESNLAKRIANVELEESLAASAAFETEVALARRQRPILHDLMSLTAVIN